MKKRPNYQMVQAKKGDGTNSVLFGLLRDGVPISFQSKGEDPRALYLLFQQYVFEDIIRRELGGSSS